MSEEHRPRESQPRSQWQTLEEAPRRRGLGQSTIFSVVGRARGGPLSPWIAMMVVIVLVGVTFYVGWLVRNSARESVRNSLQTVLAANTKALDLWLADQRETALQYAADDSFAAYALNVLQLHSQHNTADSDNQPTVPLALELAVAEQLGDRLIETGYLGWAIVDARGNIVESSRHRFDGRTIPLTKESLRRLSAGESLVTRPFEIQTQTIGQHGKEDSNVSDKTIPVMCAICPITGGVKSIGSIALMIDPAQQFSEILSVAQIGASGETYAFDQQSVMISRSRFDSQLRQAGLLQPGQASPLKIHVRDPGFDIRSTPLPPNVEPSSWPMTTMADDATRGGSGYNVVGYNDYRGVPVVGAWKFFPDYGFGVATQMDAEEAFAPLVILRNSFLALVGAVMITASILLAFAWITRPRENDSDRVEEINRRLGQYDLQQRIGRGGMGTVYLGAHGLLDRNVAIKVLENADATERSLARFQREVQLTARLKHPNTIEIYDFGRTQEGTFFYVMEFVDGISMEQLVDYYGRQPAERVIYLLLQICGSIAEAHGMGMIHRDIKPANVLLTSRSGIHDLVKVLDFGLAKQTGSDSMQLTRVDSLTGTPLFMSPESIRDAASSDTLSDIYSIGAVGYTLLTGMAPFEGETSTDICAKKLHGHPERPDLRVGVPLAEDLQSILMRCLHLDPKKRPQSAGHLAKELLNCADSPHWTQTDAALWWQEVFDGPYLDDFEISDAGDSIDDKPDLGKDTQGDTAVNERRPIAAAKTDADKSSPSETPYTAS